jgi:amino acid permease
MTSSADYDELIDTRGLQHSINSQPLSGVDKSIASARSHIESSSYLARHYRINSESGWVLTAFLLLTDVVGTGVFGLASAFRKLGWFPGIVSLLLSALLGKYTGNLLCIMTKENRNAETMGILAKNLNNTVANISYYGLYGLLFILLGGYLLICGKAIQGVFYTQPICLSTATLYGICVLLPLCQARRLYCVALMSTFSALTILIILAIIMYHYDEKGVNAGSKTELLAAESFGDVFTAVSAILYAFAGHPIYVEIMYEMHEPGDFNKTLNLTYPIILITYTVTACVGYYYEGNQAAGYLIDVIPSGKSKVIANVLLVLHICISYTLSSQVLSRALHSRMSLGTVDALSWDTPERQAKCLKGQWIWFIITIIVMGAAFVTANTLTFFSTFIDLIGSLFVPWYMFVAPATMYLFFMRGKVFSSGKKIFNYFLILFGIFLSIAGLIATVKDFLKLWGTYAAPWSC